MASVRLVLALNQGPQKAFMSHFFLKFFFTFVFSLSLSADLLPSMLKNHSFKRWDLFVLFLFIFQSILFSFYRRNNFSSLQVYELECVLVPFSELSLSCRVRFSVSLYICLLYLLFLAVLICLMILAF